MAESLDPIAALIREFDEDTQVSVRSLSLFISFTTIKAKEYGDTVLVVIIHIFIVKQNVFEIHNL